MIESEMFSGSSDRTAPAETTGRYVVTLREDQDTALPALQEMASGDLARPEDFDDALIDMAQVQDGGGLYLPDLGVAVVNAPGAELRSLMASGADESGVIAVEPERVHHVRENEDYVRGYRDGVNDLAGRVTGADDVGTEASSDQPRASFTDTADWTWGLEATRTVTSPRTGAGIRVAVLDTGFTTDHPDFQGRDVMTKSFIPNESVEDGHGHGTHCIGTACGPKNPAGVRRYGVAFGAAILAGKVLSNAGSGTDAGILAGIAWALAQDVTVISMSLGADVQQVSKAYTQAGRKALARGALIVAAAGNNANRPGNGGFVGMPANAPTIIAVGAVDSNLNIARFSARSNPVRGGQVDLAGPGVAVFSSWKHPENHRSISGTSMATPHVAGLAALWAEQTGRRGWDLWATLAAESTRMALPSVDVGGGLVTAPQ